MAKDVRYTRDMLTPEQKFKIVTAILIEKGIITKEEIEKYEDAVVGELNAMLDKDAGAQMMMNLMGGMLKNE
jgi:hypothetical protein